MIRLLRRLLCWLFGHRPYNIYRWDFGRGEHTGWKCARCQHDWSEQWDDPERCKYNG